jgi:predicted nucleotidyltransferase
MEKPESDFDIYRAYIVPTTDILKGIARQNSHQEMEGLIDRASHEIGVIINQLLKGNVNHLWGTMSPIIIDRGEGVWHNKLREIVSKNISKNVFHSINGMAYHNYQKYIIARDMEPKLMEKKCNTVVRTLNFGIEILKGHGFRFEPVSGCVIQNIQTKMEELEWTYKSSSLPENPPDEDAFRDFLLNLRLSKLNK